LCHFEDFVDRMGEIRVHLADCFGALLDGVLKTLDIGGAQAHFPGAMEHFYPSLPLFSQVFPDLAGTIRGIIVYDQYLQPRQREVQYRRDQDWQVLGLVISWNYNRSVQELFTWHSLASSSLN
jgi:hypothetical protein